MNLSDPSEANLVTQHSSPAEKIALFRRLFGGRTDVYPRRFVSRKTGKAGYSPVCGNEWVRGVCEKPRIKCGDCPHRMFLSVTDETVRWHLSGKDPQGNDFVMGVYPMLVDESTRFLAIDFDKQHWQGDVSAMLETCRALALPCGLERSRSGNGGHLWFFFEQALPASLARKLGSYLLTETMERRPEIGLDSYDRLFPNQDTLPRGGFGNLIALPLQKEAREKGNSVFLNDDLLPYEDQWDCLSRLGKIPQTRVEELVNEAERKGRVLGVQAVLSEEEEATPWKASPSRRRKDTPIHGPLPEKVEVVLGDQVYVEKAGLPPELRNRILRLAAFQNPEFYRAQAMRLPTFEKPRVIGCAEEFANHLALPRGCGEDLVELLSHLKIATNIRDERFVGKPLDLSFCGSLRAEQQVAAEAMLKHEIGVLAATTAFGKTVLAAWLIAQRGVNTLVLVHRQQLLEQWVERLTAFLGVSSKSIGRLGGGKKSLTGGLDVALIQSLVRKQVVDDRVAEYGHLVVDECHHLSAHSFELVARRAKARYVTGLSATVQRKDGHHPIIFMQCGPVRHRVDARKQAAERPFDHKVCVRPTGFVMSGEPEADVRKEFQRLFSALVLDEKRNQKIIEDVLAAVKEGRSPLVLTERTEHLEYLAEKLAASGLSLIILQGGKSRKEMKSANENLAKAPESTARVVLATGRYVGEGFDDARLDTLFLALPISWKGTVAQYAGRLHRLYDGKREVRVYDYADLNVPMFARMFDRRCRGYESIGYTITMPASATPGWPSEVPLPEEPEWKQQYARSVRRLAQDGVDTPLAELFVGAVTVLRLNDGDEVLARSASEAFLFRRLETLKPTQNRFRLNQELPIPFNEGGFMEVDFLCQELRLVLELDGPQHLTPEAFRRDRKKDALLQKHGYFVLRFLAEDVPQKLDEILDQVIGILTHRASIFS